MVEGQAENRITPFNVSKTVMYLGERSLVTQSLRQASQGHCHKLQMYGTQWLVKVECCNGTMVRNVLGEM